MGAARKLKLDSSSDEAAAFLGVTVSARGMLWRERLAPADAGLATAISQRQAIPELLGRVLAARGVTLDDAATYLDPTIKALLPDPSALADMDLEFLWKKA